MNSDLSTKEIAEKYLGRQARILDGGAKPPGFLSKNPIVIIIGYTEGCYSAYSHTIANEVVIRFIDPIASKSEWSPNGSLNRILKFVFLDKNCERGWRVDKAFLELCDEVNNKPQVCLYTHKCKYCKSPSLIQNKRTIACSNPRCKSWRSIRKWAALIASKVPRIIDGDNFDNPFIIKCVINNANCSISYVEPGGVLHCRCGNSTYFECLEDKWYAFIRDIKEETFFVCRAKYNHFVFLNEWSESKDYYRLK